MSFHSAETLTPEVARERILAGVKAALARLRDFKPYIVKTPVTLEITFKNYMPAEVLSFLRVVERVDSHTIRYVGKDMDEVEDFEEFISNYNADLAP
jgi:D-amino peptidase